MAKLDISDLDKLYDTFDSGHGPDHQQAVRDRSRVLAEMYAPDKLNLVDLAARLHDIGLAKGRESHEQRGAEMVVGDPRFKKLPKRQLRLLVNAIRQHRASTGKPRSIVGKIVSDADRIAGSDVAGALRRSFDYGQKHAPHLTEEGQYRRVLSYLAQKFAPEGIGRRHYFPETGKALADIFDPIIEMHKKDDLDAIRKILQSTQEQEKAAEFAPGLPDPRRFGNVPDLPKGRELLYVVQKHLADRAGPHFDLRFGENLGTKPSLFSWAAKHLPSEPGEKRMMFQQPLHTGQYADFEGDITSGYGKGKVKTHDKGRVVITKVQPDKISFVVTHKKHPEMFTMVRTSGAPTRGTERTKRTQGGSWLMINTTPTDVIAHKKVRYSKVDQADIEKLFSPDYLHEEKIDGAAALYKLFSDKIEILSYRPSTSGRPIVHTYRVGGTTGINIPKRLVGSVLRGELYGVRRDSGEAIPAQELGGILNASTSKSLKKQQAQGVELRNRIFNVIQLGKQRLSPDDPRRERIAQLEEIMQHLPQPKFGLPRRAETPDEQRKMWEEIRSGKNPLTEEGIVAWPAAGGKPTKVKLYEEHDVHVKDIFPGEKRLAGVGAGGFGYSTEPGGPRVGEVGTGFTEETRRQMLEDPDQYIGRVARVKAQAKFPSGALRAPSFLSLHEDYPGVKKTASAGELIVGTPSGNADTLYKIREILGGQNIPMLFEAEPQKWLEGSGGAFLHAPNMTVKRLQKHYPTIAALLEKRPDLLERVQQHGIIGIPPDSGQLPPQMINYVMGHEIGHGTGLGADPTYRTITQAFKPFKSPMMKALVGAAAATPWSEDASMLGNIGRGALGGALTSAPSIFEEMRADLRARKAISQLEGKQMPGWLLSALMPVHAAFYAAPSAAWGALGGAGVGLLQKLLQKKKKEKEPQEKGPQEKEPQKKEAAAGAIGAGLVGAGLAGPDIATKLIKDKTSKLFNAVVSQTPDYNARYNLRKALGAEEVPHMKLLEMMGDSAKSAPNSINYFAPTADNASFIQTVMTHKPEFAQFARKHGLVLSKGTLTPSSFAHEMGHATGLGQSGLYRKLIGKLYGSGKNSPAIGAVVGGLLGLATKHPKLGALAGGGAAALMHAPTLFEEGRASLRASNALKKLNLKSDQALPYMTYVAPAAGAAAVGAGTSLLAGKLRKLLTLAKKAHADGLTKSGSPHAAEGDYVLNLLAQMKRNPAIADKLYAAGMREKSKFIPKMQEQAMLQEQSDMTLAPTTLGQGATQLAMSPAFNVGVSGIGGGYRTARGLLGGAKGPGALASMWKAMQPRAVGSSVTQLASPTWLKFGAGLEGALGTLAAMNDPRYQRGEIPLWKAMIGQVGRMGQSSQIGMAKTMDKPYGTLKGMALSPLQGISSPIGTVTGFGQALGRLGGKVFGKESDMKVLESIIKKAIAAEGGEGTTLADLAKAAQIPDFEMHDEGPQVPDFMQPKRTSIRDWILSRIMGMPTGDIDNLRSALGGASRVAGFFKGAPRLKDQPQFDLSPFSE